ncbi:MAG TPA: valine--tRNA ligase [Sedimentisphaerales bacterium]|nr:valine--tRNA ligase [Sedimentisphaerales bacterium]
MSGQLSKVYEPKITEEQANELWFAHKYFHAEVSGNCETRKAYTIVIPPPNVTAPLHLGHALNNTLQDILIRFRRMQGYNTLWMPGTDHAGIATQTVVEKRLLAERGKRRTDFEREEFVAHVQAWKDEYEACIIGQLKAMGCSCDWERTRFTMDQVCAKAVRAAFFKLFKDGLIYRGKRLVNWDPATQTVLADDEVEYETVQGHFWYMRYPLVEPVEIQGERFEHVTVATTRPETMLGDTAVAMNPNDPRAKHLVGKMVRLPIVGRVIPIIADEHVVLPDPESEDEKARYSTGFLKVTPAHDPDDWEIGQRHGLDIVNVMAPNGSISDKYGWGDAADPDAQALLGMDRFEAREAIVEWFRQENLLEDVREYTHEVGHSYRSHVPIEPYLSDQWYIAVKKPIEHFKDKSGEGTIEGTDVPVNSLAGLALKPLLDGRLRFIPERYARTYQSWLENLRDWPISRQLWWGHRIPVWRCTARTGRGHPSKTIHPDQYQIELQIRMDDFSEQMGTSGYHVLVHPKRDKFFICSSSNDADEALNKVIDYRDFLNSSGAGDGQEIPTFTLPFSGKAFTAARKICNMVATFEHDEDVLDTWFSSALWPFSTMGWPDNTPELKMFYPGDVLCTAREIITLWVSRMVMMGQYCAGDIPFSDVFIHAMIQDGEGRKMSKSLGNGIDPLVIIGSHGADAMRFTLASMTTQTQDVRMPVQKMKLPDGRTENTSPKFDFGRNFCNKLWNASRFALMNLEGVEPDGFEKDKMTVTDRWILSRLARTAAAVTEQLDEFKYSEPITELYRFFWNDFCDWYLEWIKPRMQDEQQKPSAQNVLAFVLDQTLRLLHPFVPFITEGIFQKLNEVVPARKLQGLAEAADAEALVIAQWPRGLDCFVDGEAEKEISITQDAVRAIRDLRSRYNIAPAVMGLSSAKAPLETARLLDANADLICRLAGLRRFSASVDAKKPGNAATAVVNDIEIYVHDVVDADAERRRLEKQKQETEKAKQAVEAKLNNDSFVAKAKPQVVAQAREKLARLSEKLKTIERNLSHLKG